MPATFGRMPELWSHQEFADFMMAEKSPGYICQDCDKATGLLVGFDPPISACCYAAVKRGAHEKRN
ncbi:MAG: hypothetical protein Q8P24_11010 [Desulfobacterales bacterium]|nr:hypothetical protein [Desulfobacterales bacterium]